MANIIIPLLSKLLFFCILYQLFTFSLIFTVVFFPLICLYLIRLYYINPQVPFIIKLIDIRLRIDSFLMGVYSGHFSERRYNLFKKFNNFIGGLPPTAPDPPNTHVETIQVPSLIDDKQIRMRIFVKYDILNTDKKLPIIFFLAPGGFQVDLDMRDKETYLNFGCILVTVSYRLAPENKFPVALEDCYSCLNYISKKSHEILKYWDSRLILYGQSAGGNLAATSALLIRDRGLNLNVICQVLCFPALFVREKTKSHVTYRNWYIHGEANVKFVDLALLKDEKDYDNPYLCPLKAESLKNLPPALFIQAERDYFCSDGELYCEKLKENGIEASCKIYPAEHGFMGAPSQESKRATEDVLEFMKKKIEETK